MRLLPLLAVLLPLLACGTAATTPAETADATSDTATDATTGTDTGPKATTGLVTNQRIAYTDGLHNENTDLIAWQGKTWLVFRGGETSQLGSDVARLKVWSSVDLGDSLTMTAEIFMPERDIRDPKFLIQDDKLVIYAISRVPGGHLRDDGGLAWTVRTESSDGIHWSAPVKICDELWGFWRYAEHGGALYATSYNDGDTQVALWKSTDNVTWTKVSLIMDAAKNVPSEAELQFFGDTAVALVREDDGATLLDEGHTAVCVAPAPFTTWDCGRRFDKRLDGPKWWLWNGRQLIIARKHLPDGRKRTAFYEIHGKLDDPAGTLSLEELFEFKSAGDTSYVGVQAIGGTQFLVSWYSSDIAVDPKWGGAMFGPSDIWFAWLDLAYLPAAK